MERVLGGMNKVIVDDNMAGKQGVVPYLPLNQLSPKSDKASGSSTEKSQ